MDPLPPCVEVQLRKGSVLVIETPDDEHNGVVRIVAESGERRRVEAFGCLLGINAPYQLLRGRALPLCAWSSAIVRVEGSPSLLRRLYISVAEDVTFGGRHRALIEYHATLKTFSEGGRTPVVVICGGPSTGKHHAAKTLGNHAAKLGAAPTIVDLCPASQMIGLPSCIAAVVHELPVACDEPYDHANLVLSIATGSASPMNAESGGRVSTVYRRAVDHLLRIVRARIDAAPTDHSGVIAVVPSMPSPCDVVDVVRAVERGMGGLSHVLCMADAELFAMLGEERGGGERTRGLESSPELKFIAPSAATPSTSPALRRKALDTRCREVFDRYGSSAASANRVVRKRSTVHCMIPREAAGNVMLAAVSPADFLRAVGIWVDPTDPTASGGPATAAALAYVAVLSVDATTEEVVLLVSVPESFLPSGIMTVILSDVVWREQ